ncbi:MAG: enolase C-terminal domain-like protein [Candidatus Thermoplasmatota archaeon]|nr:enolase C-terminal domain-like protein [Candidatus Thermoplasmatota archaeon]
MSAIDKLKIRKIFESRGNETVEVEVFTSKGFGRASAPGGASVGKHEAVAYPKNNIELGIKQFKELVAPQLIGMNVLDQRGIDEKLKELDATDNFSKIGGSIAIATSLAVLKCAANVLQLPVYKYLSPISVQLPIPVSNVLGGGKHAIRGPELQEFLAIPFAKSIYEALSANFLVYRFIREELKRRFPSATLGRGDEGSWVANLGYEEASDILAYCCREASDKKGIDIKLGLDFASSELYNKGKYWYRGKSFTKEEHLALALKLVDKYNIFYLEDPFEENDFESFAKLTSQIGDKCLVVGDDLFATNSKRLLKGISLNSCNAILIKPNQIGTVTEAYNTLSLAHNNKLTTIVSHRSGETTEEILAHLAVGFGSKFIKAGIAGGERLAKLNELIRIEEDLKK